MTAYAVCELRPLINVLLFSNMSYTQSLLLIYLTKVKNYMQQHRRTTFIVIFIAFALTMQLNINSVTAQAQNTTLEQNHPTKRIVDLEKHTITIIDKITNETLSVRSFTPKTNSNATQSETFTTNAENATSSGILVPEKTKINDTLAANTTNTQNTTTTLNLTDKFESLKGK